MSTTTTLDELHDAITGTLRDWFADRVAQVGAYEPWDPVSEAVPASLVTPALLLECEGVAQTPWQDAGGRLALSCTWVVHCVLSIQTERLQQTLPQFAAAVMGLVLAQCPAGGGGLDEQVRGQLWGLGAAVEPPEEVQAQAGEFVPGLHGRDSWVVRWEQVAYLSGELDDG